MEGENMPFVPLIFKMARCIEIKAINSICREFDKSICLVVICLKYGLSPVTALLEVLPHV